MAPRSWAATVVALALVLTSLALLVGATSAPAAPPTTRPHGVTHKSTKRAHPATRKPAARRHAVRKHRPAHHVSLGMRAVQIANRMTGAPYVWGGESPSGFDCSGLVRYVYGRLGISLPHHAGSQYGYGRPVSRRGLRPGDLVFFYGLGHVGIYAGHGKFIHAPRSGTTVRWQSLAGRMSGYVGARRLVSA